jgi:hypothetical protein
MRIRSHLGLLALAAALHAADKPVTALKTAAGDPPSPSSMSGPILGWVFDRSVRGVRPILGIGGASVLGEPLDAGFQMEQAAVSPSRDYILAVAAGAGDVLQLRIRRTGVEPRLLAAAAAPDRIALSPTGSAAALYYSAAGKISVVSGLPDAPAIAREVELPAPAGALAISDDGEALLVSGEDGSLFLASPSAGVRLVATFGHISAVAFLNQSRDALAADDRENAVYLIRDVTGAPQVLVLAGEKEGIAGPVAVAASSDNQRAFVASAGARGVVVLSMAGGAPALIACDCVPAGLERVEGNDAFRLTPLSREPMWMLDGDAAQPRVTFVPPPPPNRSAGGQPQ